MSNRRTLPRGYGGIRQGNWICSQKQHKFLGRYPEGAERISLEEQRKVLGLESVKDQKIRLEISSRKRPCRFGRASAREPWELAIAEQESNNVEKAIEKRAINNLVIQCSRRAAKDAHRLSPHLQYVQGDLQMAGEPDGKRIA
jgi:hypothetical protein